MGRLVHAESGRDCPWISPRLPNPVLCGAYRLATKDQHKSGSKYHCSHRCQQPTVCLHDICAHHISPIALRQLIFRHSLVFDSEVAWPEIQGSAIRWLIDNLTEDAEMEQFIMAIPGSFNTDWGTEVWRRVGNHHESEDEGQDEPVARPHSDTTAHQPSSPWSIRSVLRPIIRLVRKPTPRHPGTHATTRSPIPHPRNVHPHSTTAHIRGENVVHELSTRVARSVEICKNHKRFSNNDGLWQKRTRACIEATASFGCCAK